MSGRTRAACWLGLLGLVVVIYGRSLDDPFHFDDHHSIVGNPHLRSLASVPRFFVDPSTFSVDPSLRMYRPLLLSSFALNHAWSATRPWSYHLVNLLVHAAVVIVIFEWLFRWLGLTPALLGAMLFAVHPVHSEAVYYVSSRSESLAALWVLLALLLLTRTAGVRSIIAAGRPAVRGPAVRRPDGSSAGFLNAALSTLAPIAAFACGLLTKSTAIVFVALAGLHDLLFDRGAWRRRWPIHAGCVVLAAAYLFVTRDLVAKATLAAPVRGYAEQIWSQVKGVVYYAHLLSVPRGLSVDHQFQVSTSPADPYAASAAALVGSAVVVGLSGARQRRRRLFLLAWFFVALAPASLVPLNVIVNEHRLYLAGVAVAAALAWLAHDDAPVRRGTASGRRRALWGWAAVVPVLGLLAFQRGAAWDAAPALWVDAMRKGPAMARPPMMLAHLEAAAGRHEAAIPLFVASLERDRRFVAGYEALAASQRALGRSGDAVTTALRATRAAPAAAESWALLAEMTRRRAQDMAASAAASAWYERSARAYVEALRLDPDVAAYHDNLGNTLQVLGRPAEALVHHRRAVQLAPGQAASHLNLGNALWMLGRAAEAEAAWRRAVAVDPAYEPAWRSLEALTGSRGGTADRRPPDGSAEGQP